MPIPELRIETNDLGKRFTHEWIFRKVNLKLTLGNYVVLGPNGSGKSTLLQTLWGQNPPSEGKISYLWNDKSLSESEVFNHISLSAPYLELPDEFTLAEVAAFHFKLRKPINGFQPEEFATKIGLHSVRNRRYGQFSSGMRQRVKLGLAILTESAAVFLDEPATNLDINAISWYREMIAEYGTRRIIVIASNNPAEYPTDAKPINLSDFKNKTRPRIG